MACVAMVDRFGFEMDGCCGAAAQPNNKERLQLGSCHTACVVSHTLYDRGLRKTPRDTRPVYHNDWCPCNDVPPRPTPLYRVGLKRERKGRISDVPFLMLYIYQRHCTVLD